MPYLDGYSITRLMRSAILFFCISFLAASCRKELQKDNSQKGFHCKVNGMAWHAETDYHPLKPGPFFLQQVDSLGYFQLEARYRTKDGSRDEEITLIVFGVHGTGTYPFYTGEDGTFGFIDWADSYPCGGWKHDPDNPGSFTVTTYDTLHGILRGTFHAVLVNPDCSVPELVLSDGEFGFNFQP